MTAADVTSVVREHYKVHRFRGGQGAMRRIADVHLLVRRWQVAQGYGTFGNGARLLDSQPDLLAIDHYYIRPGGDFWVASTGDTDTPVGFIGLHRTGVHTGALKRLAVLPAWQCRGVGTHLLSRIVAAADARGITELRLATGRHEQARPLYERVGFVVIGFDDANEDYLMCRIAPGCDRA